MRSLADEVPFDIPDSWEWVRLGSIGETNDVLKSFQQKQDRKTEIFGSDKISAGVHLNDALPLVICVLT